MNPERLLEPRWERRKEARPAELTAAALELFVERGFAATRLDDVARRAGVSKGTLYLYFDSKEDLFKAVVREGIVSKFAEAELLIAAYSGSSADLLKLLIRRWWTEIGATNLSGLPKLVMGESGNFPELAKFYHDEVIQRGTGLFETVIRRGMASGEFRAVNLEHVTRLTCAPVVMLMVWRHSFGLCSCEGVDPAAYLETHADMVLRGLAPPQSPVAASHAAPSLGP